MRRRQLPGEPEPPTKGELKRRAQSIQQLADRLVDAPEATLQALELPEALRDAVMLARRITSHAAQLRQRQYVGKLMRRMDVEPLRAALESAGAQRQREARRFRQIERWRDRIVAEGETALAALNAECPGIDTPALRRSLSEARRTPASAASRRAFRELFRLLSDALPAD